ncbi:hypothetical protein N9H92_02675 [Gammaproteobacteria bacterium]|nr:hypothetical protein [Gammaproteobacteria bacterium]MDA7856613.1 hypothetical protein [Gammaproteobacteria bacterium]MDA9024692.1 hypothetical protein [Gammaproteobacteria bacterium]MDA9038904.1 hypothetical protein [Gammaproteobacteria bacterium]
MDKLKEILTNHISNWNMVWFGLIFWGSVFNAIAIQFEVILSSLIWYLCGLAIGLIAKIRGTWLWKA